MANVVIVFFGAILGSIKRLEKHSLKLKTSYSNTFWNHDIFPIGGIARFPLIYERIESTTKGGSSYVCIYSIP